MPERIFEVYIDGYVFPDTVTVFLVNDDDTNSRNYVSKGLYEDVCDAIDAWRAENAKLREILAELVSTTILCQNGECNNCQFGNPTGFGCTWDNYIRELGIEVDG